MKTAYISKAGLRILIETFPDPDGGITINNHFCANDEFIKSSQHSPVVGSADSTEESYHLTIRSEVEKRSGIVIQQHSTPLTNEL